MGILLLLVLLSFHTPHVVGFAFTLPVDMGYTVHINGTLQPSGYGPSLMVATKWGVDYALNLTGRQDIEFEYIVMDNEFLLSRSVQFLIENSERGYTLIGGNIYSQILTSTGQAGSVYHMAQLSSLATSSMLSDKIKYPYVSRICAADTLTSGGIAALLQLLHDNYGRGWDKVAILSSSEAYALSMASSLIGRLKGTGIEVSTYQQFIPLISDVDVQVREIKRSGARVIVVFTLGKYDLVLREAMKQGLIDNEHAWFVGPSISGTTDYYKLPEGTYDYDILESVRGQIGCGDYVARTGPAYDHLRALWIGSGRSERDISTFVVQSFDMGYAVALSVAQALDEGLLVEDGPQPDPEEWSRIIRGLEFEGASGYVEFTPDGDRVTPTALVNFSPEAREWTLVGHWTDEGGLVLEKDHPIIWHDNTTNVPDLDIRPPLTYWSCTDAKKKEDPTGKTVHIHKPDRDGADNISEHYHCDDFLDCDNLSDESHHCDSNYTAVFIAFGILTGILILISCCLIPFVIVFGYVIRRKRVRASSPPFLILVCLSCIVGFVSTFAWYGKPHPVACGFQPWLLGLSVVSLISALSAKTWRLWRLFGVKVKRGAVISDLYLLILYLVMVLPALIILIVWTIVSTPTAKLEERSGEDHYVCTTGGFTGKPGGLVFFFVLVGYETVVLLFAAFLTIVTRNVPSFFNESKLIAISIYNLGFLAAVVIPVFMVLQEYNPYAAWIIRTLAILYAFAATLFLQFVPKIFGMIVLDRGHDVSLNQVSLGKTKKVISLRASSSDSLTSMTSINSQSASQR